MATPPDATHRPLVYIKDTAPQFDAPDYEGERYEATAPDTYDIQERARAVQNVMTRAVDAHWDYLMYFRVEFAGRPAVMWHGLDDVCHQKYMQALPLIRLITGDDSDLEIDRIWLEAAFKQIDDDGLNYFPRYPFDSWRFTSLLDDPDCEHYTFGTVSFLAPFALQHLLRPDDLWLDVMRRQTDGLRSLAIDCGNNAFIPYRLFPPGKRRDDLPAVPPQGSAASEAMGFCLQGLGLCYRVNGYEPAGELARKFCYYLKDDASLFNEAGRFLPNTPSDSAANAFADMGSGAESHFHAHALCLLNMLEYALPADDQTLLEFIKTSFEWARGQGERTLIKPSSQLSSAEYIAEWQLGYFPENLFAVCHKQAESCEIADMIGIGLKLSAAGIGDYWDDADQWIRNQFAENQLMDTDWVHALSGCCPPSDHPIDELTTDADVIERNRGAFAGWAMPNAWMAEGPASRTGIMHCCTANGARAIYYIWEHILHHDNGTLRVNLLMNRASHWADVDSHIPCQGRVDVRVKQPLALQVRIPRWTNLHNVRCLVNDTECPARFAGRYLLAGQVNPGDTVTITFPIAETGKYLEIEKQLYNVVIRGADVVKIDPPGIRGPFYQRDHYRTDETRWRQAKRFVPAADVVW
jgi:hypothetical protein